MPSHSQRSENDLPDVEVSTVRSELTSGEWTFRDRRHHGFVIEAGKGRVKVREGEIAFQGPCLLWLPAAAEARLQMDAGTRGTTLAINEIGLVGAISTGPFAGQMRATLSGPLINQKLDALQRRRLTDMLQAIDEEGTGTLPAAHEASGHLLALFCITVWRLSGPVLREARMLPRTITHRFLHAVDIHFRDHWTIARYAAEIGVTPDRLNATILRTTQRSPLALIHARLMHEAEAMLDDSNLQVAEIAEELGFSDPAYFSRFYKRLSGYSPNMRRKDITKPDTQTQSFAAWP